MKRVTVKEVQEAYKKTGLSPSQGAYLDRGAGCSCPLGALTYAKDPKQFEICIGEQNIFKFLGLEDQYGVGFVTAVDELPFVDGFFTTPEHRNEYKTGYKDGEIVRKAVLGK